jgi:hypothetical protein
MQIKGKKLFYFTDFNYIHYFSAKIISNTFASKNKYLQVQKVFLIIYKFDLII